MGITVRYYDPRVAGGIAGVITDKTRAIFVESPGSLTFEVQDLPAIAAVAGPRDIAVVVDNSWATPLYYHPLALAPTSSSMPAPRCSSGTPTSCSARPRPTRNG